MKPFIKWAGGKAQLAPDLMPYFPDRIKNYYEPFLGGGAMFLHLLSSGSLDNANEIILNDINPDLMEVWRVVQESPVTLTWCLRELEAEHQQSPAETYAKVRRKYNERSEDCASERAAWFIYLNKAGFNGLYRVNKMGHFNVPFGKKEKVNTADFNNILDVCQALGGVKLAQGHYNKPSLSFPTTDWFVYMDPPYVPLNPTSSFTAYTPGGFNYCEQVELANACASMHGIGVKWAQSNSDSPVVRELYSGFNIHEVQASRRINCKGEKRGKITELLITNY